MFDAIATGVRRAVRASALDTTVFREVRDDSRAIWTGLALVVVAGVARGIGDWRLGGGQGIAASVVLASLLWVFACAVVTGVGRMFTRPRFAVVLRTCALAAAPATLLAFIALPLPSVVRTLIWVVAHLGVIIAFPLTVREALGIETRHALYVCVGTLGVGLVVLLWVELVMVGRLSL